MEATQKKRSWKRRGITATPGAHTNVTMSRMTTFRLESICSHSSVLRNIPDKNEDSNSQDKAIGEYKKKYMLYLLRVLQGKQIKKEGNEKEVKKCLVSLKKEYEELVMENVILYEQCQKVQLYGTTIDILNKKLEMAKPILMFLKEKQFYNVLVNMNQNLVGLCSQLHLTELKKEDIEEAFEKSYLGFNSNIYKIVSSLLEYSREHKKLLPEIIDLLTDIQNENAVNEEFRKRCLSIVAEVQSCRIKCKYKKYLRMALEEYKDLLGENHQKNGNFSGERICLGAPSSSSTPN